MGKQKKENSEEYNNQVFTLDDILGVSIDENAHDSNDKEDKTKKTKVVARKDRKALKNKKNDVNVTDEPAKQETEEIKTDENIVNNEQPEVKEEKSVKYIPNPLPVPKRREHVTMDYAIEVSDDDDFDITDMTGMDFFDYE